MLCIRYNKNIGEKVPRPSCLKVLGELGRKLKGNNLYRGQGKFLFLEKATFMLMLKGGRVVSTLRNCMWSRTA